MSDHTQKSRKISRPLAASNIGEAKRQLNRDTKRIVVCFNVLRERERDCGRDDYCVHMRIGDLMSSLLLTSLVIRVRSLLLSKGMWGKKMYHRLVPPFFKMMREPLGTACN